MERKGTPGMPDPAAREPAEGDLEKESFTDHLRAPDEQPSSGLPVESGALFEEDASKE